MGCCTTPVTLHKNLTWILCLLFPSLLPSPRSGILKATWTSSAQQGSWRPIPTPTGSASTLGLIDTSCTPDTTRSSMLSWRTWSPRGSPAWVSHKKQTRWQQQPAGGRQCTGGGSELHFTLKTLSWYCRKQFALLQVIVTYVYGVCWGGCLPYDTSWRLNSLPSFPVSTPHHWRPMINKLLGRPVPLVQILDG